MDDEQRPVSRRRSLVIQPLLLKVASKPRNDDTEKESVASSADADKKSAIDTPLPPSNNNQESARQAHTQASAQDESTAPLSHSDLVASDGEHVPETEPTSVALERQVETSDLLKLFDRLNTPAKFRERGALQTPTWNKLRENDTEIEESLHSAHKALDAWDDAHKDSEQAGELEGDEEAPPTNDFDEPQAQDENSNRDENLRNGEGAITHETPKEPISLYRQQQIDRAKHNATMKLLKNNEAQLVRTLKGLKREVQKGLRKREMLDLKKSILEEAYAPLFPVAPPAKKISHDNGEEGSVDQRDEDEDGTKWNDDLDIESQPRDSITDQSVATETQNRGQVKSWRTVARRRVLQGVRRMKSLGKDVEQIEKSLSKLKAARNAASDRFQQFVALRCAMQVVLEEKQELEEETLQGEQAAKDGERLDETRTEPGQRYQATVGVPTAVEACLSRIDRFEQRHYTPEPADINLDLTGDASTLDLLRFMAQGPVAHAFTSSGGVHEAHEHEIHRLSESIRKNGGRAAVQTQTTSPKPLPGNLSFDEYPSDDDSTTDSEDIVQQQHSLPAPVPSALAYEGAGTSPVASIADFDDYDTASSTDEDSFDAATAVQPRLPVTEGLRAALDILAP